MPCLKMPSESIEPTALRFGLILLVVVVILVFVIDVVVVIVWCSNTTR